MLNRLLEFKEKYEFVGDVRGRGLLLGLDLVNDNATRRELSPKVMEIIFKEALRRGLLIMGYFPRVRLNPPLVINEGQAMAGLEILEEVFAYVSKNLNWRSTE
jgi:4-aminobutyrate aminotransferase-like enzyme